MAIEIIFPDPTMPGEFSTDGIGFPNPINENRTSLNNYRTGLVDRGQELVRISSTLAEARARLLFIPFIIQVRTDRDLTGVIEWYQHLNPYLDPEKGWLEVRGTITENPSSQAFLVQIPRDRHRQDAQAIRQLERAANQL